MSIRHCAVFTNNRSDKAGLISRLLEGPLPQGFSSLEGKRGVLFSKLELDRFIEEEVRHDQKVLTQGTRQSLQSMSSGERKRALLRHLLALEPDYLVLDNPFDNLDSTFQQTFKNLLAERSDRILMVLLLSRRNDLVPFISRHAFLEGDRLLYLNNLGELAQYLPTGKGPFEGEIPAAPEARASMTDPLVELKKVSVSYEGKPILKDIDWKIRPGEFWQLTGRNGSGKTTVLSMITGDNPKGYGQELYLFGRRKGSGESVWEIKRNIGYFTPAMIDRFGGYHPLEHMLISGLTDSIGLYVKPTEAQVRIARQWLQLLGLNRYRNTYFHDLGAGLQRLVMCARAMIKHPLLLILDEPTAGLDDESAALFVSLVNKIGSESQTSIIYVSHREEPGLNPQMVFHLENQGQGSRGWVVRPAGQAMV